MLFGQLIPVKRDDVFVVDRGYIDLNWFKDLDDKGAFFVTRLKKNAYERRDVGAFENIYSDQIIELKGFYSSSWLKALSALCPMPCRPNYGLP